MFAKWWRHQYAVYGNPLTFPGDVLFMVMRELEDPCWLVDEWRDKYVDENGVKLTIEQLIEKCQLDEGFAEEFWDVNYVDCVVVYEPGCGDEFMDKFPVNCEFGNELFMGERDGKQYYLYTGG